MSFFTYSLKIVFNDFEVISNSEKGIGLMKVILQAQAAVLIMCGTIHKYCKINICNYIFLLYLQLLDIDEDILYNELMREAQV